ncbi:porin family protein [Desertivirga brevis]|uniref:porin family protein n=1 Tax=Desertivirga brevis TaxID=2810310 RepID=UPI001A970578|nr:porin family protein [Pedobacter sp. SYSU D00873]
MKKIALLAVAFLAGTATFAQSTSTTSTGTKWGLKAGVNIPKYSFHVSDGENPETSTITNFHVTGYSDIALSSNFSFQPGISLQGKGGEFGDDGTNEYKQSTMWIEVPLNLVAKLPLTSSGTNFFVGAGPYAAYGIAGQNKIENKANGNETTSDVKFGDEVGKDLKSFDMGFNFIGGFQLNNGFNIGAGYGLGINDLRPKNTSRDMKQTNRVWSFSVGYAF